MKFEDTNLIVLPEASAIDDAFPGMDFLWHSVDLDVNRRHHAFVAYLDGEFAVLVWSGIQMADLPYFARKIWFNNACHRYKSRSDLMWYLDQLEITRPRWTIAWANGLNFAAIYHALVNRFEEPCDSKAQI